MRFTYMKTPINHYTFANKRIKEWVESRSWGKVLNLFAGMTILDLDETRVDLDITMPADYHEDALDFCRNIRRASDIKIFNTAILDPPYSYRKSMEFYNGKTMSRFNQLKDELSFMVDRVITFGYHSVSMGQKRNFRQVEILLMSHGGAIHDTIAIVEDKCLPK